MSKPSRMQWILIISGLTCALLILLFAFGWKPASVIDQENFVAEGLALLVEGTLFAVLLGYLLPERIRKSVLAEENKKWEPIRGVIDDEANRCFNWLLSSLEKRCAISPGGYWEIIVFEIVYDGGHQTHVQMDDDLIKLLDVWSSAMTPELVAKISFVLTRSSGIQGAFHRLSRSMNVITEVHPGARYTISASEESLDEYIKGGKFLKCSPSKLGDKDSPNKFDSSLEELLSEINELRNGFVDHFPDLEMSDFPFLNNFLDINIARGLILVADYNQRPTL